MSRQNEFESRFAKVNGKNIHYVSIGSGKVLLLVHGWSNNWVGWTLLARELAQKYKVVMVDLPGFGNSDELEHHGLDEVAGALGAFMSETRIKPAAIVGASLGSLVTAKLFEMFPKSAKKMVLIGAPTDNATSSRKSWLYFLLLSNLRRSAVFIWVYGHIVRNRVVAYGVEFFLNAYRFDKRLVDKYSLPGRKKVSSKAYVELGLSAKKWSVDKFFENNDVSSLFIYGEAEKYADLVLMDDNTEAWGAKMELIGKCGHNPGYEQPKKTFEIISRFVG